MRTLARILQPVRHPSTEPHTSRGPRARRRPEAAWVHLAAAELGERVDAGTLGAAVRAGTIGLPLLTLVVLGLPFAIAVAGLLLAGPRALERPLRRRRAARRDAQLAGALERVAAGVRSGSSTGAALQDVAADHPEPLGDELRAIDAAVRAGAPLGDALDRWAASPGTSHEVLLAAAALTLAASAGGQVARALDGVAATLRERRQLQAEVRALATQARASAWLLALAPLGFTGLVATIEPAAIAFLVTSPIGLACLALGITLDVVGAVWMTRVVERAS